MPTSARRASLWWGLLVVTLCAAYASQVRLAQWSAWQQQPALYLADGVPMMSTLDAYYSLRIARLQAAGRFVAHGPVPQRHYARPEQLLPGEWYDQREPKTLPLLSRLLAAAAPWFGGIDRAGLLLPPLLSSLFMLPLFWCCWRLGAPAAGLMGGLVGTFCSEYYRRTSIGWVDTDALNLFFPWLVTALLLAMSAGQQRQRLLLTSALAGVVWYLFAAWYPKPGLSLVYAAALAGHLALAGVGWGRLLLCVATFTVFAGPAQFVTAWVGLQDFAHRYLGAAGTPAAQAASLVRFPEVWTTISEARALSRGDTLRAILPRADLAVVGLLAWLPWLWQRRRSLAALMPMLLLGGLALVSSRRFIPYLAPLVGIGWGLIVGFIVQRLLERFDVGGSPAGRRGQALLPVAAALASTLVVFAIAFAPRKLQDRIPLPAVPAPVLRDLQTLAGRLPAESRLWTWWDLGFAIVDTTGFGVYHDGAAQYTLQTNLVAASFVDADPAVLHDLIRFVDREGNRGILRQASAAAGWPDLLSRMRRAAPAATDVPVHVLFTPDMLLKYNSLRTLATPLSAGAPQREGFGIRWLPCERVVDDRLHCGRQIVDLGTGWVRPAAAPADAAPDSGRLRRALLIEGGQVRRQADYTDAPGLTLQIVFESGVVTAVYLLDEEAFASNLNQMYLLGRFDDRRFREVYRHLPFTRVFRVVPAGD